MCNYFDWVFFCSLHNCLAYFSCSHSFSNSQPSHSLSFPSSSLPLHYLLSHTISLHLHTLYSHKIFSLTHSFLTHTLSPHTLSLSQLTFSPLTIPPHKNTFCPLNGTLSHTPSPLFLFANFSFTLFLLSLTLLS